MAKRILAVVFAVVLSLALFTACGGNKTDGGTTTTTINNGDNADANTTTTTYTVDDSFWEDATTTTVDGTVTTSSGGDKVNTTAPKLEAETALPFAETQTWTLFFTEHAYQPVKENSPKWNYITELTNVVLEPDVASGTTAQTKLMAAAASGKMYDITVLQNAQLRTYNSNLFMDLTNVIKTKTPNYYNLIKGMMSSAKLYSVEGKMLGFHLIEFGEYEENPLLPYIRMDVLEDNNIPVPQTWTEWFDVMKQLKKKYPDSTPVSNRSTGYLLQYWTNMLGIEYSLSYDASQNKYVCGMMDSRFPQILQFMRDCYTEGILDPNFDNCSEGNLQNGAVSGKIFFWTDSGSPGSKVNSILQQSDPDARFVGMNFMDSPFNNNKRRGYKTTAEMNFQSMYCLSSQAKNPDLLLAFMDWCYTAEGCFTNSYGKLGVDYKLDKNGVAYMPQSVWSKYLNDVEEPDFYKIMSDRGAGQLCFAPYCANQNFVYENYDPYPDTGEIPLWKEDFDNGACIPLVNATPDITPELQARYDSIDYYLFVNICKFIKGERPMTEYNTFLSELKTMGVEELLAACNKSLA